MVEPDIYVDYAARLAALSRPKSLEGAKALFYAAYCGGVLPAIETFALDQMLAARIGKERRDSTWRASCCIGEQAGLMMTSGAENSVRKV